MRHSIKYFHIITILLLFNTQALATVPATVNLVEECEYHEHEAPLFRKPVPYMGGRQSPGDIVGTTYKDLHEHTHGKRIMVDDRGQVHINWMKLDSTLSVRYCAWNGRFTQGGYFGETQASESYSGFVQLDVTPDDQKSVIAYHERDTITNTWYAYIDIDTSSLGGGFPNDPKTPHVADHIWPYIAVANNGNIVMATGDYSSDFQWDHLYLTIDNGNVWSHLFSFDSCTNPSRFIIASPYSNKIAFVHTRYKTDTIWSGLDHDVWYIMSTDGGGTWGPHTNITHYQPYPMDSVRAFAGVDAGFDINDNLHVVWEGRKVTDNYYQASKIFHWDEESNTISVVNTPSIFYYDPGGWWMTVNGAGEPGCYRMPADRPQIVIDRDYAGRIFCLWHGNDDYNDYCSHGRFNEELYAAYSLDNGLTWSKYVNLTNTRSPGAPAGQCMSEDFMTASPGVVNDSIVIAYIEDKDAGHMTCWGEWTENPVRCWIFPTDRITGIHEDTVDKPGSNTPFASICSGPLPVPSNAAHAVFDISGRQVHTLNPAPGIYFVQIDGGIQQKVIKIK
jgi:hypothetical protein